MFLACGFGITAGAHRLWSHRSYKATLPLKILLMIFHTAAFQLSIIAWARDHRLHHKYSETDADPYNAKRYFCLFRHICPYHFSYFLSISFLTVVSFFPTSDG